MKDVIDDVKLRYLMLPIFCEIFFEMGFCFVAGGVLKMAELFVRIKGCGVRGSHLRKVGGRGGVGSAN
jgi:hypothetical protein